MEPKLNYNQFNPCGEIRMSSSNSLSLSNSILPSNTTFLTPTYHSTNQINTIMQNRVAVFKVVRDENEKIIHTEFIKELWVETKNGQTVDFQVARDKDLAEYEANDLVIKTTLTVTF